MKKRVLNLLVILLFGGSYLMAQNNRVTNYYEGKAILEKQLEERQKANNKSSKYLKRWLWLNQSRLDAYGAFPSQSTLQQASNRVQNIYEDSKTNARNNAAWMPIGPNTAGTRQSPTSNSGIGRVNTVAFHPTDPNTFWIGTPNAGLWKTSNHGENWTPINTQIPFPGISAILVDPVNPDIIYVASGDFDNYTSPLPIFGSSSGVVAGSGIYKTTDGGTTWNPTSLAFEEVSSFSLFSDLVLLPDSTQNLVVSGLSGTWASKNAGTDWTLVLEGITLDLVQDPTNPEILYTVHAAADSPYGLYKSVDFGATWTLLENTFLTELSMTPLARVKLAVAPSNPDVLYGVVVNEDQGLLGVVQSKDAGLTWEIKLSGEDRNILGYQDGDPESDVGGQGAYDLTLMVDNEDENRVFVGGVNQWGSEDGGENWDIVSFWVDVFGSSLHADQHSANYNPVSNRYFITNDGGIYYTDSIKLGSIDEIGQCFESEDVESGDCYKFPTEWTNISEGLSITEFYRVAVSAGFPEFMIAGSQDNSSFYKTPDGWLNIFGGDGMDCMIRPDDPGFIYGSNEEGSLNVSLDAGGEVIEGITGQLLEDGDKGAWVTPLAMNMQNPDIIYTGMREIYRSENGGQSWTAISNFNDTVPYPLEHYYIALASVDPTMLISIKPSTESSSAIVRTTADNGTTWTDISAGLPEGLLVSSAVVGNSTNDIFLTIAAYQEGEKVYRSNDGGQTWVNYSKDLPNIPVHIIAHHLGSDNNQVYIGTEFGVFYTNDEMENWAPMVEDLPMIRINDLEISYASEQLIAATYGRGLWSNDLLPVNSTSIEDLAIYETNMVVAPNPNNGTFQLSLTDLAIESSKIEIVDVLGRTHYSEQLSFLGDNFTKTFNLDLPAGMYYLRLSTGNRSKVQQILID